MPLLRTCSSYICRFTSFSNHTHTHIYYTFLQMSLHTIPPMISRCTSKSVSLSLFDYCRYFLYSICPFILKKRYQVQVSKHASLLCIFLNLISVFVAPKILLRIFLSKLPHLFDMFTPQNHKYGSNQSFVSSEFCISGYLIF